MNTPKPMEPFLAAAVQDVPVLLHLRPSVQKSRDPISKVALSDYPPAQALFANRMPVRQHPLEGQCCVIDPEHIGTKKVICTNEPNSPACQTMSHPIYPIHRGQMFFSEQPNPQLSDVGIGCASQTEPLNATHSRIMPKQIPTRRNARPRRYNDRYHLHSLVRRQTKKEKA